MLGLDVSSEGRLSMVMMLQKQRSHQLGRATACQNGAVAETVFLEKGSRRPINLRLKRRREIPGRKIQ